MINPGRFRDTVSVQAFVPTPDGAGGEIRAWNDVAQWSSVRAEIAPLKGDEQLRGMQLTGTATHRVRMWAIEGLKSTTHRIRRHRDNVILQIIAPPAYDWMRVSMELLVRETETVP